MTGGVMSAIEAVAVAVLLLTCRRLTERHERRKRWQDCQRPCPCHPCATSAAAVRGEHPSPNAPTSRQPTPTTSPPHCLTSGSTETARQRVRNAASAAVRGVQPSPIATQTTPSACQRPPPESGLVPSRAANAPDVAAWNEPADAAPHRAARRAPRRPPVRTRQRKDLRTDPRGDTSARGRDGGQRGRCGAFDHARALGVRGRAQLPHRRPRVAALRCWLVRFFSHPHHPPCSAPIDSDMSFAPGKRRKRTRSSKQRIENSRSRYVV